MTPWRPTCVRRIVFAMINKIFRTAGRTGFITGAALVVALAGCSKSQPEVQYVNAPAAPAQPAAPAPVVLVQPTVAIQDDYVYYPAYEVYYSSNRHDYLYRDGNAWLRRPAPPRVSVDVLFASPSVRLDFHDMPERHHESVIRSYPRNWAPPARGRGEQDDRKDERKDDRKEKR
jgi:hypothetical protein